MPTLLLGAITWTVSQNNEKEAHEDMEGLSLFYFFKPWTRLSDKTSVLQRHLNHSDSRMILTVLLGGGRGELSLAGPTLATFGMKLNEAYEAEDSARVT